MDVLEHFRKARNIKTMPRGAVLFTEGESGSNMYVLVQGRADISVGGEVLESAVPGSLLGEMALVSSAPRSATVVAATECKIVAVDTKTFDLLARESPEFARHVMTVMANRLRHTNERLREALREIGVRGGRKPR
jgi:CRP/FNR family cyclic AMP-dependent transcriptional regulator